jgi:two-component system response regulator YesN
VPRRIKDQNLVIVEDDPFISEALETFFKDQNKIKTFGNAEDALAAKADLKDVGVFILDYKLPAMNGIELFKHLQPEIPTAKYILITGEMSYEMADSTRQLGFDALILKPFDFMILEDNISALLSAAA